MEIFQTEYTYVQILQTVNDVRSADIRPAPRGAVRRDLTGPTLSPPQPAWHVVFRAVAHARQIFLSPMEHSTTMMTHEEVQCVFSNITTILQVNRGFLQVRPLVPRTIAASASDSRDGARLAVPHGGACTVAVRAAGHLDQRQSPRARSGRHVSADGACQTGSASCRARTGTDSDAGAVAGTDARAPCRRRRSPTFRSTPSTATTLKTRARSWRGWRRNASTSSTFWM